MINNSLIIFDLQGTLVKSMRPPILNGSVTTIQKLAQKNVLSIFTGATRTETLNILNRLNISQFFSPKNIVIKGSFSKKPNPEAVFWLISNNQPDKTYYIGDTRKDYKTAKNAKIPFVYVGKQKLGIAQISSLDQLLNVKI